MLVCIGTFDEADRRHPDPIPELPLQSLLEIGKSQLGATDPRVVALHETPSPEPKREAIALFRGLMEWLTTETLSSRGPRAKRVAG